MCNTRKGREKRRRKTKILGSYAMKKGQNKEASVGEAAKKGILAGPLRGGWGAQSQYWISDPPSPFIFVPLSPLFQWVRLSLEARGQSAAARTC